MAHTNSEPSMPHTDRTPAAAATQSVGVIGLGIIGSVWARHYADAGLLSATWSRSPKLDAPHWVSAAQDVVRAANVLHLVVSDPAAVGAILSAVEPELGPQHLLLQSTTIDPDSSRGFAERVKARGAAYVEAPFMGSRPAAEQKKVVFVLGGAEASIARARPLLSQLSAEVHAVGLEPQAAALKLSFNLQVAIIMEGLCESLNLARQANLPEDAFFRILDKTALWSGFHALKEPKLRRAEFSAQFSIKHMLKDIRLATRMAKAGTTPLGLAMLQRLQQSAESGLQDEDMAALIKTL